MNKRKGSLYEQQSKVTQMLKSTGQVAKDPYMSDEVEQEGYPPRFQQLHHKNYDQHHSRLQQVQNPQFKIKNHTDQHGERDEMNQRVPKQILGHQKQNRARSAQRSSSLDKRRQEIISQNQQHFIENAHLISFIDDLDADMEKQIYEQSKQKMLKQMKQREENEKYKYLAQRSQQIEVLRNNYQLERGGPTKIEESLLNQLENSTHYQEEFIQRDLPIPNWDQGFLDEANSLNITMNQHSRSQYRKSQLHAKKNENTDTTDEHNVSVNPNNKSSSDEAIMTSAEYQYKQEQCGNDSFNGNYLTNNYHYPKKNKIFNNPMPARELSTSHDTTKLFDDDSGNKQQSSDNNIKLQQHNQYHEYLSETQIQPFKNSFNKTHPINNQQHFEFLSEGERGFNMNSKNTQRQENKRKNTPSQGSSCKHTKKNLSIISDQFEDIYELKMLDKQLCPKQSEVTGFNKSLYQRNPKSDNQRSKSETKNTRKYRDYCMVLKV